LFTEQEEEVNSQNSDRK